MSFKTAALGPKVLFCIALTFPWIWGNSKCQILRCLWSHCMMINKQTVYNVAEILILLHERMCIIRNLKSLITMIGGFVLSEGEQCNAHDVTRIFLMWNLINLSLSKSCSSYHAVRGSAWPTHIVWGWIHGPISHTNQQQAEWSPILYGMIDNGVLVKKSRTFHSCACM